MLDVRDSPAVPNELGAAMVTWLPVSMSTAVFSDQYLVVLALGELNNSCSGTSLVIAGLSMRPPLETANRSTNRPFTTGPAWSSKVRWS